MRILPLRYCDIANQWNTEPFGFTEGTVSFLEGTVRDAVTKTLIKTKHMFWGVVSAAAGCVMLFEQAADCNDSCGNEDTKGSMTLSRWIFLGGATITHQPEDDVVQLRLAAPACEQCVVPNSATSLFGSQCKLRRAAGAIELAFLSVEDACEWYLFLERTIHLATQFVVSIQLATTFEDLIVIHPQDHTRRSSSPSLRGRSSSAGTYRLSPRLMDELIHTQGISFDAMDDSDVIPLRRESQFLHVPQPFEATPFDKYVSPCTANMYSSYKEIGKGGQGKVYVATRCHDGILVAIKVVPYSKQEWNAFENEVKLLTSSEHPYIVKLLAVHRAKNSFYIVMENLGGGKLTELILPRSDRRHAIFSDEQISAIMFCVVMALEYLHERDIVHGDLKTDNILCAVNGTVKLADFGHAQFLSGDGLLTRRTGTRLWQAPELQDDKRRREGYGKAVDVWSLGIVFLELCDGLPPSEAAPKRISATNGVRRSDDAHSFASFLLQPNPHDRPSIGAVKAHPFLQQRLPSTRFLAEILLAKQ